MLEVSYVTIPAVIVLCLFIAVVVCAIIGIMLCRSVTNIKRQHARIEDQFDELRGKNLELTEKFTADVIYLQHVNTIRADALNELLAFQVEYESGIIDAEKYADKSKVTLKSFRLTLDRYVKTYKSPK